MEFIECRIVNGASLLCWVYVVSTDPSPLCYLAEHGAVHAVPQLVRTLLRTPQLLLLLSGELGQRPEEPPVAFTRQHIG